MHTMQKAQIAYAQMQALGPVWIGADIPISKRTVIAPGVLQEVCLLLHRSHLPPIPITRGTLHILNWSVRSFLAQSGIEPLFYQINLSAKKLAALRDGKTVPVPIQVRNYGMRAVELEGNIMRFFLMDDSKRLRGEELRSAVSTDFIIEGTEGIDWNFLGVEMDDEMKRLGWDYDGEKDALSIQLNLNKHTYYIPPNNEPVRIKSRQELTTVLVEVPSGIHLPFSIGETCTVRLSEHIYGVIPTTGYDGGGRHIRSPLIDAGFQGKIRTETCNGLPFIELFLYRK